MKNCKPVFTKFNKIYFKRPRLPKVASPAWLPAMVSLAKSQRREVEALCRGMTQNSAGAQMLHYLLRWWKSKPLIRMTESDWQQKLGLSKKEIRYGKKALGSAGVDVKVITHKTGRATVFMVNPKRFIARLKTVIGTNPFTLLKALGVCPTGTDGSVQRGRMGLSNGGQTVITESSTNLSHQKSDDDKNPSDSDSGEFFFPEEGREANEQQDSDSAVRKFLEEKGVKAPALEQASQHPLADIQRAFDVAVQHQASKPVAYALAVLKNGDFSPEPTWMNAPAGTQSVTSLTSRSPGFTAKSSAVKVGFQKNDWDDAPPSLKHAVNRCPNCGKYNFACECYEDETHA